jgi:hypothetical protein
MRSLGATQLFFETSFRRFRRNKGGIVVDGGFFAALSTQGQGPTAKMTKLKTNIIHAEERPSSSCNGHEPLKHERQTLFWE